MVRQWAACEGWLGDLQLAHQGVLPTSSKQARGLNAEVTHGLLLAIPVTIPVWQLHGISVLLDLLQHVGE